MTQYEIVLDRIYTTKQRAEAEATSKAAALFAGMDNKILKAAKKFAAVAKSIQEDKNLNPQGRERLLDEEKARVFEPAKQEYFDALEQARKIVADSIAQVEAVALPQSDTGTERAANILLWEREIDSARPEDWPLMYKEHADDKDFMKLLELSAKSNPQSFTELAKTRTEASNAVKSRRLGDLQRLFISIGTMGYFYELPEYIRNPGETSSNFNTKNTNLKMNLWTDLENFNTAKIPVSTESV